MKKGPLLVFSCYIIWGICPIYWKLLTEVSPYYILINRLFWSFIFSLMLALYMREHKSFLKAFRDKSERIKLFLASLFCVVNWGSYIIAVNTNHIVDASLAYFLCPILSIFIAAFFFHERLSSLQWIGVILAFLGVLISIVAYGHVPWLALIIGGTFSIYGAIQKKCRTTGVAALTLEMMYLLPVSFFFMIWMPYTHRAGSMSMFEWWLLPTTGIITAVPLVLFAIGIVDTDYSLSGILMYINPTLQLLVGVFIYGEKITQAQCCTFICVWLGLICYLTSIFFKYKKERRLKRLSLEMADIGSKAK